MGYAYYERDGMERGYSVADRCPAEGCGAEIDRGLAYLCYSCTKYFCYAHLTWAYEADGDTEINFDCFAGQSGQCCKVCAAEAEKAAAQEAALAS